MSSKKTTNYKLHQWEATDDFLRTEFNENFGTLDTAVRNLLIAGSYTGSGTDTRTISLGFTPRLVFVISEQADIREGAYTYGENIAAGNATAAATVEQWMNSPGHRANIMNPDFTHIGVGYIQTNGGYRHYWVQMFTGKR